MMWKKDYPNKSTSWEKVGGWYKSLVGKQGHYYHQHVIIPNVLRLLELRDDFSVLDLGCGQGILASAINQKADYTGVDLARNLIDEARVNDKNPKHKYIVADITKELNFNYRVDRITLILTLQNIRRPFFVFKNISKLLRNDGKVVMVINHPCFRIPKHSDWLIEKGVQYRKVDSYMSNIEIPIDSSPFDKRDNKVTWSFHYPLSTISEMMFDNGLCIEKIEEWVSDKVSTGGAARMENHARKEIPMFMAIVGRKLAS